MAFDEFLKMCMNAVRLTSVARSDVRSRIFHLMHLGGRGSIGIISTPHERDLPSVRHPNVACVVLPADDLRVKLGELDIRCSFERLDSEELHYSWRCQYLGEDIESDGGHTVTYFKPPRGREIAFISFKLFSKLHSGSTVEVARAKLDDLV